MRILSALGDAMNLGYLRTLYSIVYTTQREDEVFILSQEYLLYIGLPDVFEEKTGQVLNFYLLL